MRVTAQVQGGPHSTDSHLRARQHSAAYIHRCLPLASLQRLKFNVQLLFAPVPLPPISCHSNLATTRPCVSNNPSTAPISWLPSCPATSAVLLTATGCDARAQPPLAQSTSVFHPPCALEACIYTGKIIISHGSRGRLRRRAHAIVRLRLLLHCVPGTGRTRPARDPRHRALPAHPAVRDLAQLLRRVDPQLCQLPAAVRRSSCVRAYGHVLIVRAVRS